MAYTLLAVAHHALYDLRDATGARDELFHHYETRYIPYAVISSAKSRGLPIETTDLQATFE